MNRTELEQRTGLHFEYNGNPHYQVFTAWIDVRDDESYKVEMSALTHGRLRNGYKPASSVICTFIRSKYGNDVSLYATSKPTMDETIKAINEVAGVIRKADDVKQAINIYHIQKIESRRRRGKQRMR